jgi:hypothetical protein
MTLTLEIYEIATPTSTARLVATQNLGHITEDFLTKEGLANAERGAPITLADFLFDGRAKIWGNLGRLPTVNPKFVAKYLPTLRAGLGKVFKGLFAGKDPFVLATIAYLAGAYGIPAVIPNVTAALQADASNEFRGLISAWKLAYLGSNKALDISKYSGDPEDPFVYKCAACYDIIQKNWASLRGRLGLWNTGKLELSQEERKTLSTMLGGVTPKQIIDGFLEQSKNGILLCAARKGGVAAKGGPAAYGLYFAATYTLDTFPDKSLVCVE